MSDFETVTSEEWTTALSELLEAARSARAVHRPVLVLYMLGRAQRRESAAVSFVDLESAIGPALDQFGQAKKAEVLLPFWHLQSSVFWEIPGADNLPRRKGKDRPTRAALIAADARGRIKTAWWRPLSSVTFTGRLAEVLLLATWSTDEDRHLACKLLRFDPRKAATG